ncbi:MAG: hypothetical protein IJY30_07470 [Muribaculaceae bacterium]|nr:hypothetical protein [Muribaculaceae bacterium]
MWASSASRLAGARWRDPLQHTGSKTRRDFRWGLVELSTPQSQTPSGFVVNLTPPSYGHLPYFAPQNRGGVASPIKAGEQLLLLQVF